MATSELPSLFELEDDSLDAIEDFYETQGWTDGLPIVPPTVARVRAMYEHVDYEPSDVIASLAPRRAEATLERIAVNAVMAGCRPTYMPVLVAAIQAIAEEPFNLNGMQSTTHPCAVLVMVNGPLVRELNINSGHNVFGQGWRANATIGRAIRLMMMNIGGGIPGESDKSTQGTPAKFSFCMAEREEANPWEPYHVEHGYDLQDSTVTVMASEAPHSVQDHKSATGEGLLTTIAGSMRKLGGNDFFMGTGGQPLVVIGPEHAATIAGDGFSKDDVKRYLWEHTRIPVKEIAPEWQIEVRERVLANGQTKEERLIELTGSADNLQLAEHWSRIGIAVAGGAGKHSCWIPTFGGSLTQTVTRRIEHRDGTPYRTIHG